MEKTPKDTHRRIPCNYFVYKFQISQPRIGLCPDHMVSGLKFKRNKKSINFFYQCNAMDDLNFMNWHLSIQTATWRNVVLIHPAWKHSARKILLSHFLLSSTPFDWNEVQNDWNKTQNICISSFIQKHFIPKIQLQIQ